MHARLSFLFYFSDPSFRRRILLDAISDIDECQILGMCSHECTNTVPGYQCTCSKGYKLRDDHRHCKAQGPEVSTTAVMGIDTFEYSFENQRTVFLWAAPMDIRKGRVSSRKDTKFRRSSTMQTVHCQRSHERVFIRINKQDMSSPL